VEYWTHAGEVYEVNSMYLLPDDAWTYELTWALGASGGAASMSVLIPDATPGDAPFTPMVAAHAVVMTRDGQLSWPVLWRFLQLVETSGDIVADQNGAMVTGDLSSSCNSWHFAARMFEVNSFYFAEHDCWCYELYEVHTEILDNSYLDVRVPDLRPDEGPFMPAAAEHVTFTAHVSWTAPWPVLQHFLALLVASGDIVDVGPPPKP
jgi:hypothetical protein